MNEKIAVYEEILEQDPRASIFFTLASMYAQEGQSEKALQTLDRGLAYAPHHLEAQCLRIELLSTLGRDEESLKTTEKLIGQLKEQPAFWKNWSKVLSAGEDTDLALAVGFISTHLKGTPLSWAHIMAAGLELAREETPVVQPSKGEEQEPETSTTVDIPEEVPDQEPLEKVVVEEESLEETAPEEVVREIEQEIEDTAPIAEEEPSGEIDVEVEEPLESDLPEEVDLEASLEEAGRSGGVEEVDEDNEIPRTRTMADLLSDQGDFEQALGIYTELWRAEPPGAGRRELENLRTAVSQSIAQREAAKRKVRENKKKKEVIDILDGLAKRLESRAG